MPSRALNAGDEVFKQVNYRAKVQGIGVRKAHSEGLKGKEFDKFVKEHFRNSFDEYGRGVNDEALEYARLATYTNELTGFTKKFQQAVNEYPALKQLFPFIRTPFQLAKSIVDRSPLALGYRGKHLLGLSNDAKMIVRARGQMAMGTILFSSAFALAKLGMLQSKTNTVGADEKMLSSFKDSELIRLKKTKKNFKQYSFLVNGVQIPFGRLDPYGAFFGLVADIQTNYQYLKQEEIERQQKNILETKGSCLHLLNRALDIGYLRKSDLKALEQKINMELNTSSVLKGLSDDTIMRKLQDGAAYQKSKNFTNAEVNAGVTMCSMMYQ